MNLIVQTLVPGNVVDTIGPLPAPRTVLLFTLKEAPFGLVASGLTKVGFLGTAFTFENVLSLEFYNSVICCYSKELLTLK
ncbi:MAG: hypothetical protein IPH77_17420 [Ignavibacteria bacterium]|nr:hypothetical protein [Ignavibacteria bacterium]